MAVSVHTLLAKSLKEPDFDKSFADADADADADLLGEESLLLFIPSEFVLVFVFPVFSLD